RPTGCTSTPACACACGCGRAASPRRRRSQRLLSRSSARKSSAAAGRSKAGGPGATCAGACSPDLLYNAPPMRPATLLLVFAALGCGRSHGSHLLFASYTAPREVYHRSIIPAFRRAWQARTGQELDIGESYLASGAQSRAIAGGFEADVAALALEPD